MRIKLPYRYIPVVLLFLAILATVLFRMFNQNGFRYDASLHADSSRDGSNILYKVDKAWPWEKTLLVDLGPEFRQLAFHSSAYLRISPDSILVKKNLGEIRKHRGPVILISSDPAIAARVWMIISQMGFKEVYILPSEINQDS